MPLACLVEVSSSEEGHAWALSGLKDGGEGLSEPCRTLEIQPSAKEHGGFASRPWLDSVLLLQSSTKFPEDCTTLDSDMHELALSLVETYPCTY